MYELTATLNFLIRAEVIKHTVTISNNMKHYDIQIIRQLLHSNSKI